MMKKHTVQQLKEIVEQIKSRKKRVPNKKHQEKSKKSACTGSYYKKRKKDNAGKQWERLAPRPKETPNKFKTRCVIAKARHFQENPNIILNKCRSPNVAVNETRNCTCSERTYTLSKKNQCLLRALNKSNRRPNNNPTFDLKVFANALNQITFNKNNNNNNQESNHNMMRSNNSNSSNNSNRNNARK